MLALSFGEIREVTDAIKSFKVIDGEITKVTRFNESRITNILYKVTIENDTEKEEYLLRRNRNTVEDNEYLDIINCILNEVFARRVDVVKLKGNRNEDYIFRNNYNELGFSYWFCYKFKNYESLSCVNTCDDMKKYGAALATIHKCFGEFGGYLPKKIPDIHNTSKVYREFLEAITFCNNEREDIIREIKYLAKDIYENNEILSYIVDALNEERSCPRLVHNNSKLTNFLFDKTTGKVVDILSLEEVSQGSILFDIGDAIRYGCNTASEDEVNLNKVEFDIKLYESFVDGYYSIMYDEIMEHEVEYFHLAPQIIALELAMKFLTDYLHGNVKFPVIYPTQNIDRARVQIKLAREMNDSSSKMKSIVEKYDDLYLNKNK